MEIKDLREHHANPRKITGEMFKNLTTSMDRFGDLGGIVFNRLTGELVSGHQRVKVIQEKSAEIIITDSFTTPSKTGTVAVGYVISNGEKFTYREVSWSEDFAKEALIAANKIGGIWDDNVLANSFGEEQLLRSGFTVGELGFAESAFSESDKKQEVEEEPIESRDKKKITIYFAKEDFDGVRSRFEKMMEESGIESDTGAFMLLLERYEESNT